MARYIDADIAINLAKEEIDNGTPNDIAWKFEALPTADVVEIVRCKDCKYEFKDGKCPLRLWYTHTNKDYCSYGERK